MKKKKSEMNFTLWESLERLFESVHYGDGDLSIPCQGGVLMDPETHPFLVNNRVPDQFTARAVELLALKGGASGLPGGGYSELDALDIAESLAPLTEFAPRFAAEPMVLVREGRGPRWMPKKTNLTWWLFQKA